MMNPGEKRKLNRASEPRTHSNKRMAGFRLVASLMNDPCAAGNGRSAAALRHVAAGHKMILRADNLADWLSAIADLGCHPVERPL